MKPTPIGRFTDTPSYEELQQKVARLRLTDEEREAIAWIALTHSRLKTAGDRPGRTKEMDLDAVWGFLDRTK